MLSDTPWVVSLRSCSQFTIQTDRSIHDVGVAWNHIHAQETIGDLSNSLAKLTTPGLFIHGKKDPLIPVQGGINTAQATANAILKVIPGMGHMMFNYKLQENIASILLQQFKEQQS